MLSGCFPFYFKAFRVLDFIYDCKVFVYFKWVIVSVIRLFDEINLKINSESLSYGRVIVLRVRVCVCVFVHGFYTCMYLSFLYLECVFV